MREMLTDQSFESFRAYSLDTVARLAETIAVAEDIRRDRLPKRALEPVQAELAWSLGKDPVAKDLVSAEISSFENLLKDNKATVGDVARHVRFLIKLLGQEYKSLCENKIQALYADDKKRVELRQVTGFYCSHLINLGYSKEYLLQCVRNIFFAAPMNRVGRRTLMKFFRIFDNKPKKFLVCTAVSADFGNYLKKLDFYIYDAAVRLPKNLSHAVTPLLPITSSQAYMLTRQRAYDDYGAVAQVEMTLTSVRALAFIVRHRMNCEWDQAMYVAKLRSSRGLVLHGQALPLIRTILATGAGRQALRELTSYSGKVLTHFDFASTERILSSLNTSALAHTSLNIENQLISLWSAIEVLLSEPPRDTVRILHYVKLLVPCICLRYIRRQFVAVFNGMLVNYRKKFTTIVSAVPDVQGTDQHTKFAAILCLPNNEPKRQQLLSICSDNPLARHRLWKLHRDYSSPQAIKAALDGHEKRVAWQLHRIYRARNNLVHAGRRPNYLDSLVLNLDEFYRACLGTLVNRASREQVETDIDQLVAEIGIEYNIYTTYMDSERREEVLSINTFLRAIT